MAPTSALGIGAIENNSTGVSLTAVGYRALHYCTTNNITAGLDAALSQLVLTIQRGMNALGKH